MIDGYTSYLRTLASKLSHELNTPLAIVKSSLDNLELVLPSPLPPGGEAYLSRARDGLARGLTPAGQVLEHHESPGFRRDPAPEAARRSGPHQ